MYSITQISITVLNNYLKVQVTQEAPKESKLTPRIMFGMYPKNSSYFVVNTGLYTDSKGGESWTVLGMDLVNQLSNIRCQISNELIEAEKVTNGKEAFTLLTLETFLSENTGE